MDLEKIYKEISNNIKTMTDEEIKQISDALNQSVSSNVNHLKIENTQVDTKNNYKVKDKEYGVNQNPSEDEKIHLEKQDINQVKNSNISIAA